MARRRKQLKKRSAAKPDHTSPPDADRWLRDPLTFFIDRSLQCKMVIDALTAVHVRIECHRDHFLHDAVDTEWLSIVGERKWIVLMKDQQIRKRPLEWQAFRRARVRAFCLTSGSVSGEEMVKILLKHLTKMERLAREVEPPFIASITKSGVTVLT